MSGLDRPDLSVRRVALNRAISTRRRRDAEQRALRRLERYHAEASIAAAEPFDELLRDQVKRLPRRQAQLVVLVYHDDQSVEQAAATLGLTPSTARTHLQRARATLAGVITPALTNGDLA